MIEIKYTINIMHLNHPETISPPQVCGKTVFQETGPWCQKGWELTYVVLACELVAGVGNCYSNLEG